VALVATYNEGRFIGGCVRHLRAQGLHVYLIDNESTDDTVALAREAAGPALAGLEILPRDGVYRWRGILERKAEVASQLDADWILHLDADERPLPPPGHTSVREALDAAADRGFNAVNFTEVVFVPTHEEPDHDHPDFESTMRFYYPFDNGLGRLVGWRRQFQPVDLVASGGHRVDFAGRRVAPEKFVLKHYLFLSEDQARSKYVGRTYAAEEIAIGWHHARAHLRADEVVLTPQSSLRPYRGDSCLDTSAPFAVHPLFAPVLTRLRGE
jgi:glycosyltransferase involved in cell wall biosynthesis